jgi:hypothetical protein
MTEEEMQSLARLLAEDDFAKDLTLGISAEKAEMLDRLRALRPWKDERYRIPGPRHMCLLRFHRHPSRIGGIVPPVVSVLCTCFFQV